MADLTAIVSDEARRDNAIQLALGTSSNPTAMFVLTQAIDLDLATDRVGETPRPPSNDGGLSLGGLLRRLRLRGRSYLLDGARDREGFLLHRNGQFDLCDRLRSFVDHGRHVSRRGDPDETAGPFPVDGSTAPNVLDDEGIIRADGRYGDSAENLARLSLDSDVIFADGRSEQ
ncbi:MAG TPA: hypothetical protein VJ935_11140 [Acidimicrobiia bacterium]|nr:hypothetical protein [Acidimicrobiia bacterium]